MHDVTVPAAPTPPLMPTWVRALALLALAGALAIVDLSVSPGSSPPAGASSSLAAPAGSAPAGAVRAGTQATTGPGSGGWGTRGSEADGSGPRPGRPQAAKSAPSEAAGRFGRGGAGAGGSPGAGPSSSPAAATDALDTYLRALAHEDATAIADSSDQGPYALAGILLDSAAIDGARGATTTVTVGPSSLSPTAVGPGAVTFGGSVVLTTTISGSQGAGTERDTIAGPVTVSDESGVWRVTDFTYDGRPLEVWPEDISQTIDGLTATVGYVVSYGTLTAALMTLTEQSGSADVQLQTVTLAAGGASESGTGDFTGPPTPTGVLRFARVDATPRSLSADFSSSGQPSDYVFSFSFSPG
jgi:hypothetical protein